MHPRRVAIDTMYAIALMSDERTAPLAELIATGKIEGILSVVSITEMISVVGRRDEGMMRSHIDKLLSSEMMVAAVSYPIARQAGLLRLRYGIPTVDALIAATGIQYGASHLLTEDAHFSAVRTAIKPVDLKQLLSMSK
jgi:predicted nucleic acid-binding protein